jgi:hypothetical protein
MKNRVVAILSLLLAFGLSLVCAQKAHAIAAFSRLHKTECSTCHTIYPELNEYGQAFQKNGYVYSIKQKVAEKTASSSGKDDGGSTQAGQSGKNEGLMLAGIPEILPISFTANQSITYNDHATDKWDFATRSLVLQGGGSFRDLAGFYMTFDLFSHATQNGQANTSISSSSSNLDELFLVWRHLFDTPVNIKFGKFEPRTSLWKKNDTMIPTAFATTAFTVGLNPFRLNDTQDALEANAVIGKRVFLAGGIVDVDGQNTKEGYGHVSVKFGGADFLGNEPEVDFEHESIWDYLTVTLAAYGYSGRNFNPNLLDISGNRDNFYRAGGEMDLLYKRFRLRAAGVTGRDTNAFYSTPAALKRPLVLAAEAQYLLGSPVMAAGLFRYEYQDDGTGIIRRYIPAVVYTPLQNLKLVLEYIYEDTPTVNNQLALLDLSFSF